MRECAACSLCCVLTEIPELGKPAGVRCAYLTDSGCGIYDSPERPQVCRDFECNWKCGNGDVWARPDIVGAFVTPMTPGDGLSDRGGVMIRAESLRFESFSTMRRLIRTTIAAGQDVLVAAGDKLKILTNDEAQLEIAAMQGVVDQHGRHVSVERA